MRLQLIVEVYEFLHNALPFTNKTETLLRSVFLNRVYDVLAICGFPVLIHWSHLIRKCLALLCRKLGQLHFLPSCDLLRYSSLLSNSIGTLFVDELCLYCIVQNLSGLLIHALIEISVDDNTAEIINMFRCADIFLYFLEFLLRKSGMPGFPPRLPFPAEAL